MNAPHRRDACPGISAPMQTGDGLLVRLIPIGRIGLDAFAGLCAAAQRHGNGVVEITARGSIQVRGLTEASAPAFAADLAKLGIGSQDGVPVLTHTLSGLDPTEILDVGALAAKLHAAIAERALAAKLAAKVSVTLDGGGALHLDAVAADVRLRAQLTYGQARLHVAVGGDAATAVSIGVVEKGYEVEAAIRLLKLMATRGRHSRARDILQSEGANAFHTAVFDLLIRSPGFPARAVSEPIGLHPLCDGKMALGIGLAFGHADAKALQRLAEAAKDSGAIAMAAAPGRVLLAVGLAAEQAQAFSTAADHLGFIVHRQDPRRHVIACAGAPICAAANIPARAIAPVIVAAAAPLLDGSLTLHLSGCTKGCAYADPAALTIVGRVLGCGVIVNGTARDDPTAILSTDALPARLAALGRAIEQERRPEENAAQAFARISGGITGSMRREADIG
jgi:precorrin-3B synthase